MQVLREIPYIRELNAFFELFLFLALGVAWAVLEYQGRRLDRQKAEREREENERANNGS